MTLATVAGFDLGTNIATGNNVLAAGVKFTSVDDSQAGPAGVFNLIHPGFCSRAVNDDPELIGSSDLLPSKGPACGTAESEITFAVPMALARANCGLGIFRTWPLRRWTAFSSPLAFLIASAETPSFLEILLRVSPRCTV